MDSAVDAPPIAGQRAMHLDDLRRLGLAIRAVKTGITSQDFMPEDERDEALAELDRWFDSTVRMAGKAVIGL